MIRLTNPGGIARWMSKDPRKLVASFPIDLSARPWPEDYGWRPGAQGPSFGSMEQLEALSRRYAGGPADSVDDDQLRGWNELREAGLIPPGHGTENLAENYYSILAALVKGSEAVIGDGLDREMAADVLNGFLAPEKGPLVDAHAMYDLMYTTDQGRGLYSYRAAQAPRVEPTKPEPTKPEPAPVDPAPIKPEPQPSPPLTAVPASIVNIMDQLERIQLGDVIGPGRLNKLRTLVRWVKTVNRYESK